MESASLKTAHPRKKVMMPFSTQNGEIFQSATFSDRVSILDKVGKCHTSKTGRERRFAISFRCRRKIPGGHPRRFLLYTRPFSSKTRKTDSGTTLYIMSEIRRRDRRAATAYFGAFLLSPRRPAAVATARRCARHSGQPAVAGSW